MYRPLQPVPAAAARRPAPPGPQRRSGLVCRARPLTVVASLLALVPLPAAADFLDFVYLEANVGGSSGGHVALKLADRVYHYQNEGGYLRLERDDWPHYRFRNTELDNRNLHVARVRVAPADAERVRDHLNRLYLVQHRHLDYLAALQRDRLLLRALAAGEPMAWPGAGFFEKKPRHSPALFRLKELLAERRGAGFLGAATRRTEREMAALVFRPAASQAPERQNYPLYPETYSERAADLQARFLALRALAEEWPLREGLLVDVATVAGATEPATLTAAERSLLGAYRERLAEAALRDLESASAAALPLTLARYSAVTESLAAGRWLVLDPGPGEAVTVDAVAIDRGTLAMRQGRLETALRETRRDWAGAEAPDELLYNRLENRAGELREVRRSLAAGDTPRWPPRDRVPAATGPDRLPAPVPERGTEAVAAAAAESFQDRIEALYPYRLLTGNCVTELVGAVQSAFPTPEAAAAALGGHLEPGEHLGFIPFRFFELARANWRVESVRNLPSQRNRLLTRLAGSGASDRLAESVTLASRVYRSQPGDSRFLFFTEDVFWPRPLFGAANLAYGLGSAAAALPLAPLDGGRELSEGLMGAVYSLPELAFWNIRKGRFDGSGEGVEQNGEVFE